MTLGQIAALIAALAFAILVVFLSMTLVKISAILTDLKETVSKLNNTIDVVTKDVDHLSIEVEGLLNKANTLVDDLNGKLGKTDPLFTAIGDVGTSVSELNDSTKEMTTNFVSNFSKKNKKKSPINSLQKASKMVNRFKVKPQARKSDQMDKVPVKQEQRTLDSFIQGQPSKTAGEISINLKEAK
ncbi:DUF948 domain-containing protein [Facklamia miroungae]|uniref:Uncharacterized protein YoxC, contains an MCP-like domain n=1 Tax=Facklamia miroungae TaxID=120956 RepID=A0A1G7R087_9LACT|nr:DUF948 domain-containing protein [Facklamia miroungae]NKZ29105.1 DUF948 domain-containing protein [Facklamia miroungae]SDG03350.1 Uncharacterized protein YoxC, contains an MCP-like domain [Facklamia miroungae]